jgi:hypothetical protein
LEPWESDRLLDDWEPDLSLENVLCIEIGWIDSSFLSEAWRDRTLKWQSIVWAGDWYNYGSDPVHDCQKRGSVSAANVE